MTNAAESGRFRIGGAFDVNRLGFGAMRIVGRGIWGPPADRAEVMRTLRRLPVDLIDTADSYGPDFSERLIRKALAPYGAIHVATKAGLARTGPNVWIPLGRPEYLIQQAYTSRWRLGVETIDLWQLHRIDAKVPANEQFDAIKSLIKDASSTAPAFQKSMSGRSKRPPSSSRSPPCRIAITSSTARARRRSTIARNTASASSPGLRSTPAQLGAAKARRSTRSPASTRRAPARSRSPGCLKRSPVMLPIPGTGKVAHLEENVGAAAIKLTDDEFATLDRAGRVAS